MDENQAICMKKVFAERGLPQKCQCSACAGRKKPGPKPKPEFPELLKVIENISEK